MGSTNYKNKRSKSLTEEQNKEKEIIKSGIERI